RTVVVLDPHHPVHAELDVLAGQVAAVGELQALFQLAGEGLGIGELTAFRQGGFGLVSSRRYFQQCLGGVRQQQRGGRPVVGRRRIGGDEVLGRAENKRDLLLCLVTASVSVASVAAAGGQRDGQRASGRQREDLAARAVSHAPPRSSVWC